jgi:hypothetical protein
MSKLTTPEAVNAKAPTVAKVLLAANVTFARLTQEPKASSPINVTVLAT